VTFLKVQDSHSALLEEKADADTQYTPGWCTRGLLCVAPPALDIEVCEPFAGRGHIVRELVSNGHAVHAIEKRLACEVDLLQTSARVTMGDAFGFDWGKQVVTNPPYSIVLKCVRRAVETGCYAAFLLRAGFWDNKDNSAFLDEYSPSDLIGLSPRPFSSYWAHCWYVWNGPGEGFGVIRKDDVPNAL
jgi:hypothetical protein